MISVKYYGEFVVPSHGPPDRVAGATRTPADPPTYHKMRFQPTPTETILCLVLGGTGTDIQSLPTLTQYRERSRWNISFYSRKNYWNFMFGMDSVISRLGLILNKICFFFILLC